MTSIPIQHEDAIERSRAHAEVLQDGRRIGWTILRIATHKGESFGDGHSPYAPSLALTNACTLPPSAMPFNCFITGPITLPMSLGVVAPT